MSKLFISLLGPFQVTLDGETIADFATDKARALLAYLAVEADCSHRRDALAGLLWPEQPQRKARHSLRQALSHLRQALGDQDSGDKEPFLLVTRATVQFNPQSDRWLDEAAFTALIDACRAHRHRDPETCRPCLQRLEEATALYRGGFLEGFFLSDSAAFEEWTLLKREWLQRLAVEALSQLADGYARRGEYRQARHFAWRQVALEPWREEAHRQLMRLLALGGERSAALAQYETCRRILAQELAVEPTAETTALYEAIRTESISPAALPVHNLPPPPTPFVGRENELDELAELLANPDCRLLTLVGPGGIGKSRLALQAAGDQVGVFAQGIYFVPLALVGAVELVVPAIAGAVNFSFHDSRDPQEQLVDYLREKEMLLVLDNFEHLLTPPRDEGLGGAELLTQILTRAPGVVLLVTSRERLNLQEEWVYGVQGLVCAENGAPGETQSVDALQSCSAIELFLQSARRVRRDLSFLEKELPHVVRICQLVEGMPLGIELAAAWVSAYSCAAIAQELEHNLDILSTSLRNVPSRHKSIQAAFEHSWNLLSGQERRAFAGLSVLSGFDKEAAEQVAGASLFVLADLVQKSLLRRDASGRYQIHTLLRQFAAAKLAARPEEQRAVRERHCIYYTNFVGQQESNLDGADTTQALAVLSVELENVRAAWQWAVARPKLAEIERGLAGLSRFYLLRGPFQEGQALIEAAVNGVRSLTDGIEMPGRHARIVLARLLVEQARLLNAQAEYDEAIAAVQAAVELSKSAPKPAPETGARSVSKDFPRTLDLEVAARCLWGRALQLQGNYSAAQVQLERSLERARAASLRQLEADSLLALGDISLKQGDYSQARVYFNQALNIYQGVGSQRGENNTLNRLGVLDYRQGRHAAAKVSFEKSLPIFTQLGDRRGETRLLKNLGNCTAELGHYTEARSYYQQALSINREIGHRRGESDILNNLAALFWSWGDYEKAWDHYEQALKIYREIGDRQGVGLALSNLCLLFHLQGNDETALDYGQQALHITQELGDDPIQGQTLTRLGYALAGLRRWSEARAAYRQALALQQALGRPHLAMETRAGLARWHLAQDGLVQAQAQVKEILNFLKSDTLQGTDEPFRVYLTCYRVLHAAQDPRAATVLGAAHDLLQEQAARISDQALRRSFLENVAAHREILAAWAQRQ